MEDIIVISEVALSMILGLGIAFILLFLFGQIVMFISGYNPDYWSELEGDFSTERMQVNSRMIDILYQIGSPEDNGRHSDRQNELWEKYYELNNLYDNMFKEHMHILINKIRK